MIEIKAFYVHLEGIQCLITIQLGCKANFALPLNQMVLNVGEKKKQVSYKKPDLQNQKRHGQIEWERINPEILTLTTVEQLTYG